MSNLKEGFSARVSGQKPSSSELQANHSRIGAMLDKYAEDDKEFKKRKPPGIMSYGDFKKKKEKNKK